jgi:hypothetical protein
MEYSSEGFSVLRKQPNTGMFRYYIFYNDYNSIERQRWTIFHEIGHAYLGHHCSNCTLSEEECEREADFFADYCIAPPPLINIAMCADPCDVANTFIVSEFASIFIFVDFQNWLQSGPREYEDYEIKLLHQFGVAA